MENNDRNTKNNGDKIILTIIGVSILLVATIGATFAYFSATSNTVSQQIKTGELKVSASSEITNNTNIKPTTWDKNNMENNKSNSDIAKITLTVDTTGTTITTGKYDILLTTEGIKLNAKTDKLEGGSLEDVKWALYKEPATGVESSEDGKIQEGTFKKDSETEGDSEVVGDVKDLKINGNKQISITADSADENPGLSKETLWSSDEGGNFRSRFYLRLLSGFCKGCSR